MLTAPLENSLIRMDEELKTGAANVFVLVRGPFDVNVTHVKGSVQHLCYLLNLVPAIHIK